MPDPLKRASLKTLLGIVQRGPALLTPTGKLITRCRADDLQPPNVLVRPDQAEAEIERRFARLKKKIKELT